MAEFCLICFNQLHGAHYQEDQVTLSADFCEGCGNVRPCVIRLEPPNFFQKIARAIVTPKIEKPVAINRRGKLYCYKDSGTLIALKSGVMEIQQAYIRIFGASAMVFDELYPLSQKPCCPKEVRMAFHILQKAITETEEFVDIL